MVKVVHTAGWPDDYTKDQWGGENVVVIGSGASSIQTVPTMQVCSPPVISCYANEANLTSSQMLNVCMPFARTIPTYCDRRSRCIREDACLVCANLGQYR